MAGKRAFIIIILYIFIWYLTAGNAHAINTPEFTSCINPQGDIQASHDTGTHGIVGDTKTYTGSDYVYKQSDSTLTQCFCSGSGEGIQTNWWKASDLSDPDLKELQKNGWIYIPNGTDWGLDYGPYVAQNTTYSCLVDPTPTPSQNNNNNNNSSSSGSSGGSSSNSSSNSQSSSSTATQAVLGLATTGNITTVYALFIFGIIFIFSGLLLSKRNSFSDNTKTNQKRPQRFFFSKGKPTVNLLSKKWRKKYGRR